MTAITLRRGRGTFHSPGGNARSTVAMLRQAAPTATLGTMPDSPLLTAAAVAVIVLAIAVVVGVGLKLRALVLTAFVVPTAVYFVVPRLFAGHGVLSRKAAVRSAQRAARKAG